MKKTIFLLLAVVMIAVSSCKKDDDSAYLTKPTNNIITLTFNNNTFTYDASTKIYYITFFIPDITQNVIDNGIVTVYEKSSSISTTSWMPLPITLISGSDDLIINYVLMQGVVQIQAMSTTSPSSTQDFKICIQPPAK